MGSVLTVAVVAAWLTAACGASEGDSGRATDSTSTSIGTTTTIASLRFEVAREAVIRLSSQEGYKLELQLQFGQPRRLSEPGPFDDTAGAASSCSGTDGTTDLAVPFRVTATNRTPNFPLVLGAGFSRVGSEDEMGPSEVYVQTMFNGDSECRPLSRALTRSYLFGFVAGKPSAAGESASHDYYLIVKNALTPNDPDGRNVPTNGFGCNGRGAGVGFMRIGDTLFYGSDCGQLKIYNFI